MSALSHCLTRLSHLIHPPHFHLKSLYSTHSHDNSLISHILHVFHQHQTTYLSIAQKTSIQQQFPNYSRMQIAKFIEKARVMALRPKRRIQRRHREAIESIFTRYHSKQDGSGKLPREVTSQMYREMHEKTSLPLEQLTDIVRRIRNRKARRNTHVQKEHLEMIHTIVHQYPTSSRAMYDEIERVTGIGRLEARRIVQNLRHRGKYVPFEVAHREILDREVELLAQRVKEAGNTEPSADDMSLLVDSLVAQLPQCRDQIRRAARRRMAAVTRDITKEQRQAIEAFVMETAALKRDASGVIPTASQMCSNLRSMMPSLKHAPKQQLYALVQRALLRDERANVTEEQRDIISQLHHAHEYWKLRKDDASREEVLSEMQMETGLSRSVIHALVHGMTAKRLRRERRAEE